MLYFVIIYRPITRLRDIQDWLNDNIGNAGQQWDHYVDSGGNNSREHPEAMETRKNMMTNSSRRQRYPFQVGFSEAESAMAYKLRWS